MKNQFPTTLFGYRKSEVDRYLDEVKKDYESELFKKRERLAELSEENRLLKKDLMELQQQISELKEQEAYISKALVKAEHNAQLIIEEGRNKIKQELHAMKLEQDKWKTKMKQVRNDILNFDNEIVNLLEKFRSEINYIMGKEISDILLDDNEIVEHEADNEFKNEINCIEREKGFIDDSEIQNYLKGNENNDFLIDDNSTEIDIDSKDTKKVIA